jgi:hypothetical protein
VREEVTAPVDSPVVLLTDRLPLHGPAAAQHDVARKVLQVRLAAVPEATVAGPSMPFILRSMKGRVVEVVVDVPPLVPVEVAVYVTLKDMVLPAESIVWAGV